jgi:hypothetical protein
MVQETPQLHQCGHDPLPLLILSFVLFYIPFFSSVFPGFLLHFGVTLQPNTSGYRSWAIVETLKCQKDRLGARAGRNKKAGEGFFMSEGKEYGLRLHESAFMS